MKLTDLGEFGLIKKIQKLSRPVPGVLIGIGDDAAAFASGPGVLLATTDMLLEGVHFDLVYTEYDTLGWKAAAVNLSDIAAMGGVPRFCLVSLGIPPSVSVEQISRFYRGLHAALRRHKTVLAGGDTCSSTNGLVVNIVLLGETRKVRVLTRAGARPGDRIFVTGTLGDSAAGLEFLKAGSRESDKKNTSAIERLVHRHLRPVPRVEWGRAIAHARCASAMIDISDGLSSDLGHICEQSKVGAVIDAEKIPISRALKTACGRLKQSSLHYALSGGEDYELLFTVPAAKADTVASLRINAVEIGVITRSRKILIQEGGRARPLAPSGYNHFAHPRKTAAR